MTDWILMLAIVTFLLVIAFVTWTKMSAARHSRDGGDGIGGSADPMAGSTNQLRHPDTMRANLDDAAAASAPSATGGQRP